MAKNDPRQVAGPSGESSRKGKGRKRKGPPEKNKKKSGNKKAYVPSYVPEGEKCVVCGDYSTGSHYRAMTCEGCKGFFRRTIQKSQGLEPNLVCKREQQCEISPQTRNACQYCRYKKCLAARMDPNSVLTEKQRRHLKLLIDSNRIERQKKEYQTLSPKELSMLLHIGNSYKSAQVADFYNFVHEDDIDAVDEAHSETDMSPSLIHVIQFVWSIPGIQKMNEDDLIKLFYNHLLDIVGFRLAEIFDTKRNELRFKNFHLRESDLQKYSYMEEIFNFAKYYAQFITTDGVILGCLCAIRFLSVDNATLVCEETVSKNVDAIQTALIKYLAQEKDVPMHALFSRLVNFENIREYHSKLLTKMACLGSCSENVFGLSFNPDYSEMFGLGQVKTFDICSSPSSPSETGADSNDDEPKKRHDPVPCCSTAAGDSSGGDSDPDRKRPKKADKGKRLVSKSKKHQPKRTKDSSVQANHTEIKSGEGSLGKTQRKPSAESVKENVKSVKKETLNYQASSSLASPWNNVQGNDPLCGQSSFGFANMPRAVKVNLTETKCQSGPSQCKDFSNGYPEMKPPISSAGLLDMNRPCEDSYTNTKPPIYTDIKPSLNIDSPYDLLRSCEAHLRPKLHPKPIDGDAQRKEDSTARQHGVCSPQTREELSSLHKPRDTVSLIESGAPQRLIQYCIPHENPRTQKPEDLAPKRLEALSPNRREEAPVICAVQRKDYEVPPRKEECVVPLRKDYIDPPRKEDHAISPTPPESAVQVDAQAAVQALLLKNAELEAKLRRLQAEKKQMDNSEGFNLHLTTNEKVRRISYMSTSLDLSQAGLQPAEVYRSSPELHQSPLYCSLVPPQHPGLHTLPSYPHLVPLPPIISLNSYSPVIRSQTQFQPYSIRLLSQQTLKESSEHPMSPVFHERHQSNDMNNMPPAKHFTTLSPEPTVLYRTGSVTLKRDSPMRNCNVTPLKGYDLSTNFQPNNPDLCQVVDMSIAKPKVIPAEVKHDSQHTLQWSVVPSSSSSTRYDSREDIYMQRQQNTVMPIAGDSVLNLHLVPKFCDQIYKDRPNEYKTSSYAANNSQRHEIYDEYQSPRLKRPYHIQGVNIYGSPEVNSKCNSPKVNNMHNSPGVNSPSPGVNSANHSPGVNSTYHSPGHNGTNSVGVNDAYLSSKVISTNCLAVNPTNSPGVYSTYLSSEVNSANSPGVLRNTHETDYDEDKTHSDHYKSDTGVSSSHSSATTDSTDKSKISAKGLKKRWLEDYSHDP